MRSVLAILLFCSLAARAQQDSMLLSFDAEAITISKQQESNLVDFINKNRVRSIDIDAYIGSKTSISRNRTRIERRLIALRNTLNQQGISSSAIKVHYESIQDESLYDKLLLRFITIAPLNKNVIYKTTQVQISAIKQSKPPRRPNPVKSGGDGPQSKQDKKNNNRIQLSADVVINDSSKRVPLETADRLIKVPTPEVAKDYGPLNIKDFKKGAQIVIPKLLFYATRHKLERSSLPSLRALLAIMRDKPTMVIQLQGHICCKKDGEDGMDFDTHTGNLSENRAKVVHDYLILNGISPDRLSYVGYGSKYKLVDDGGSAIAGKRNRRVEVFVVSE